MMMNECVKAAAAGKSRVSERIRSRDTIVLAPPVVELTQPNTSNITVYSESGN